MSMGQIHNQYVIYSISFTTILPLIILLFFYQENVIPDPSTYKSMEDLHGFYEEV